LPRLVVTNGTVRLHHDSGTKNEYCAVVVETAILGGGVRGDGGCGVSVVVVVFVVVVAAAVAAVAVVVVVVVVGGVVGGGGW
jgi:hypothetical protein